MRGALGGGISPSDSRLTDYLTASMGSLPEETLRVLFLDASHRLIADEQMQRGTIGQLILHPRVIFRRALELNAAAILLAHNHPSGDPVPSANDVRATDRLVEMGRSLDIDIVEHIVVTATEHRRILRGCSKAKRTGAAGLFDLRAPGEPSAGTGKAGGARSALVNAQRTGRRRLLRRQLLGAEELFGEPAWDMLIELFIHQCEGKPLSTSSLCIASGLSMSSALRLVQRLIDAGLVEREVDPGDGRRNFISLSRGTAHRLKAFFEAYDE
ncbi:MULTISPECIES: JAB domain-containing protein [Novosphingobium]|nr:MULTISPECIES: JAB domain-containing protein [Novosphingobium]